jgi:hypothetical protein
MKREPLAKEILIASFFLIVVPRVQLAQRR